MKKKHKSQTILFLSVREAFDIYKDLQKMELENYDHLCVIRENFIPVIRKKSKVKTAKSFDIKALTFFLQTVEQHLKTLPEHQELWFDLANEYYLLVNDKHGLRIIPYEKRQELATDYLSKYQRSYFLPMELFYPLDKLSTFLTEAQFQPFLTMLDTFIKNANQDLFKNFEIFKIEIRNLCKANVHKSDIRLYLKQAEVNLRRFPLSGIQVNPDKNVQKI